MINNHVNKQFQIKLIKTIKELPLTISLIHKIKHKNNPF